MAQNINKLYDVYVNSEKSVISKNKHSDINALLIFPNYYNVAMSNLGFLRVYELLNASEFMSCDRAFLQDFNNDDRTNNTANNKGIISIERRKNILNYDLIFFSLSYENDFINILKIFHAENIPFLSKDRQQHDINGNEHYPLIMAGGVISFLNPEPIAPLFDMMFVGEAEAIFPDFLQIVQKYAQSLNKNKQNIIEESSMLEGIYVPSAYDFVFSKRDGLEIPVIENIIVKKSYPEKIKRKWLEQGFNPSISSIISEYAEFSSMKLIEIARGCKRGCRFCSAAYIYLPARKSSIKDVISGIAKTQEFEKIGFVGLDTMDNEYIKTYMQFSLEERKTFSLSSVRFDCLDESNIDIMNKAGLKTVTLAVETGSERLKKIINKDIKNETILATLKKIIESGIMNIKAYFMLGLPTEDISDIKETVALIKSMRIQFVESSRKNKRIGKLTIGLSPFVPKAWTPLQWENFENEKTLLKKINFIYKELNNLPNINLNINSVKNAFTEAFFARGSRLSLNILINSFNNNLTIKKAIIASGYKLEDFMRKYATEEILPWDILDQGITKKYLKEEYNRAMEYKTTPGCFEGCQRCGIC
jgi:radical SAM superfamily enzyme YgiQ (UPF0313 family)